MSQISKTIKNVFNRSSHHRNSILSIIGEMEEINQDGNEVFTDVEVDLVRNIVKKGLFRFDSGIIGKSNIIKHERDEKINNIINN